MEEMKNSTELLDSLNGNLEKATVELAEINKDEELLEWPLTSVSELPVLLEDMRPFYQLWNVAFQFHSSYDIWYRGKVNPSDFENSFILYFLWPWL